MSLSKKTILIFLLLLGVSLATNIIQYMDNRNQVPTIVERTDTIYSCDTITRVEPQRYEVVKREVRYEELPVYRDVVVHDTDSVLIEVGYESKVFSEDSLYRLQVTGHNATLDWIQVFPKTMTVTKEVTVTRKTRNHFNVTMGVGGGYGILTKKPDLFVGGVIGYSF